MAGDPHYSISQTSKFSVNDLYILAHAARNIGLGTKPVKSEHLASSLKPFQSQNDLRVQICEAKRICNDLTATSQASNLPLNMVVSKTATRKTLQGNNSNPLEKFDISNIRKSKLLVPSWREKEVNRKRLQSAYFHNRRKIDEIQAMKAKLKCPRYDPNDLMLKRRYHDLQGILSESESFLRKENIPRRGRMSQLNEGCQRLPQTKPLVMESEVPLQDTSRGGSFPRLYGGYQRLPQNKPLVMESEDPLQEDVNGDNQVAFEQLSHEKENLLFSSTPIVHPTKDKFVWNPIILPVANSFSSARDLIEYYYSPQFEGENVKKWFDSPGKYTTSSTSSGLTVAEETVRLTYYAGRRRGPVKDQSQTRRSGSYSFNCDPFETTVEDWLPDSCKPDFNNYFEE